MTEASRPHCDPRPAGEVLTHRQILVVFSGLMLALLLAALDQTIVTTALSTIVGELHGLNHLSWVVTAYLLTSTTVRAPLRERSPTSSAASPCISSRSSCS